MRGTRGIATAAPLAAIVAVVFAACAAPAEPEPGRGAERLVTLIDLLRVEDEAPRDGYSRDRFEHWVDVNGSGCRTRADVLVAQAVGQVQRDPGRPCTIVAGDWYSLFDGESHAGDPVDIDVDHVVALAEAWDSGAHAWSGTRRMRFANDPLHLLVSTRQTNQDKADLDAADWTPARRDAWCITAAMTVLAKLRYDLSVDLAERSGLRRMTAACDRDDQRTTGGFPLPGSSAFDDLALAVLDERSGG